MKRYGIGMMMLLGAAAVLVSSGIVCAEDGDASLEAPPVNTSPGEEYTPGSRLWQGIPGIERTADGRLYALWYSGGKGEGPDNYVVVITSGDDGETWSEPILVIDPPGEVRAYDPVLWIDPSGRLWVFWAQSFGWFDGRSGTWAVTCDNPDADTLAWSSPRRIANGIMMNKPLVMDDGTWALFPAVWNRDPKRPDMDSERFSNMYVSSDSGRTWTKRGQADVPDRAFDEHMMVERGDGSCWMLVRTTYGIGQSESFDGGRTWSLGTVWKHGPSTRFHLSRLRSGNLLLLYHNSIMGKRVNLTAFLSKDGGATWSAGFLLDERENVSYPDAVQTADGRIYAIYDRSRSGDKEILMAVFREDDVLAGHAVSPDARLKVLVNRAGE